MPSLLGRLKQLNIQQTAFQADEITLQKQLAPILRKKAVDYLANGNGIVAKSFRGEYLASGLGYYQQFLREQSQPGTWGTYIEAVALGELMGCHVTVTPVKTGVEQDPICLYRAQDDNAPVIHLYNSNNTHWYVKSAAPTQGDGNCLFNAFAQALKSKVTPELRFVQSPSQPNTIKSGFLSQKSSAVPEDAVIKFQRDIESAISGHPTPAQLEADLHREKERISSLPVEEQQQIVEDYKLALKLSRQEMGYSSRNVSCVPSSLEKTESYITMRA